MRRTATATPALEHLRRDHDRAVCPRATGPGPDATSVSGALVALTDRPFLFLGLVAVNTVFALSSMMLAAVSPVASRGRYLAAFQYSFAFASIIAPVFFTSLTSIGMAAPWIGLAILDGASIIAILALERLLGGLAQPLKWRQKPPLPRIARCLGRETRTRSE